MVKSPGLSSGDSVSGDKSDALSDSAMGMFVDLKKVSSVIGMFEHGAENKMLMGALGNFDLLTFVVHDHESATIKLVFNDKDEQGFAQATDMILGLIAMEKVARGNYFGGEVEADHGDFEKASDTNYSDAEF